MLPWPPLHATFSDLVPLAWLQPPFVVAAVIGVLLDGWLGEPRRWHPLVGFGTLAHAAEKCLRGDVAPRHPVFMRLRGLIGWLLLVMPPVVLLFSLLAMLASPLALLVHAALLWFALGGRSLAEHALAVAQPLESGHLDQARLAIGRIVSRDTQALDEAGVARAGVETVLENGNDAVFAALFWFALLGGPGALMFRLANTLDAMWGYRTPRLRYFGWAAARLDDALNYLPARLTALSYAVLGHTRMALQCWRTQASAWDSPNAGPVMAAGAGALAVSLGGAAIYHGNTEVRPPLGCGNAPGAADIRRAVTLVRRGVLLWLLALIAVGVSLA